MNTETREVEVKVELTITKTLKVLVEDYSVEIENSEDGKYPIYDYSECDLKDAVITQKYLPKDLEGWEIDNFEVDLI